MWAEVVAATNIVAREEAERRGYLQFRIEKGSLDMFRRIIHCKVIEVNDTAEISGVNSNPDEKIGMEYSEKFASHIQWPNTGKADSKKQLCITEKGETKESVYVFPHTARMCMAHMYRRYNVVSGRRRNRVRNANVLECELETQGNFPIVVHPGHPIAKNAAAGGVAGAITGGTSGAIAGYVIGGVVGIIGGPPGMAAGSGLGCIIGGVAGGISGAGVIGGTGGALGALKGMADRCEIQFTITAEEVFRKFCNFKKVDNRVFCHVTVEKR